MQSNLMTETYGPVGEQINYFPKEKKLTAEKNLFFFWYVGAGTDSLPPPPPLPLLTEQ